MTAKAERLQLRLEPDQKALLEAAGEATGRSVSSFVLQVATEAAADVLADRLAFVLEESQWNLFDEALSEPAKAVPGLHDLLNAPTVIDESGAAE
jgi:uncharacterized protein (DUF1778 family)